MLFRFLLILNWGAQQQRRDARSGDGSSDGGAHEPPRSVRA